MREDVQELIHHGVKGQKWGVRKQYKKLRKSANKDTKAITRLERRYKGTNDSVAKSTIKARKTRYNSTIEKAANLPVKITLRNRSAKAKQVSKKVMLGVAGGVGLTMVTGLPAPFAAVVGSSTGLSTPTNRTKNDRFAEAVKKKQDSK